MHFLLLWFQVIHNHIQQEKKNTTTTSDKGETSEPNKRKSERQRIMLRNQLQDISILFHRRTASTSSIWIWLFVIAKILQLNIENNKIRDLTSAERTGGLKAENYRTRSGKRLFQMTKIEETARNRKFVCLHKNIKQQPATKWKKKQNEKQKCFETLSWKYTAVCYQSVWEWDSGKVCMSFVRHIQGYIRVSFARVWRFRTTDSVYRWQLFRIFWSLHISFFIFFFCFGFFFPLKVSATGIHFLFLSPFLPSYSIRSVFCCCCGLAFATKCVCMTLFRIQRYLALIHT